jgi:hypothetical protein
MKKIICLFLLLSQAASADNIWCGGKLLGVYVAASGDVVIKGDWRNEWTNVCNLKNDTVTCSLWASYAANALQNNTSVLLMYTGSFQCTTIPSYNSAPIPGYFMLTK